MQLYKYFRSIYLALIQYPTIIRQLITIEVTHKHKIYFVTS